MKLKEKMYHNKIAEEYEDLHNLYKPLNILLNEHRVLEILGITEKQGKVLDVGCGTGYVLFPLFNNGLSIIGVDISIAMIKHAKKRANTDFIVCDAEHLPFRSSLFTTVVVAATLHHLPDPSNTISEVYRVLNEGGHLYVDEPLYNKLFLPLKMLSRHGSPGEMIGFSFLKLINMLSYNHLAIETYSFRSPAFVLANRVNNQRLAYALFKSDRFFSKFCSKIDLWHFAGSVSIVARKVSKGDVNEP